MSQNSINTIAKGLLDIFGVKQQGQYPAAYSQQIGVGFDSTFLQLQTQAEQYFDVTTALAGAGTITAGAYNFGTPLIVPAGEQWIVLNHRIIVDYQGAAAVANNPLVGYQTPAVSGNNGFIPLQSTDIFVGNRTGTANLQFIIASGDYKYPHVVPPSSEFLYAVQLDNTGVAGGVIRWRAYLRFVRNRI